MVSSTLSVLQFSLTYFPAELCSSQTNFPVLKYFVFVRRVILQYFVIADGMKRNVSLRCWEGPQDLLHHSEVFPVVMSLEKCEPEVQLKHYATYAPNITWLRPSQLQNYLWCPREVNICICLIFSMVQAR